MKKLLAAATLAGLLWAGAAQAADIVVAHHCALMPGAPFTIALEKGYFKEAGVDVDGIIPARGGGDTIRNTLANDLPYGEAGLGAVLAAREKGADVVVVNSGTSSISDLYWLVRKDSPITSIEDLKGKKVGITNPKGGSDQLTRQVFQKAGIPLDSVEIVATGGLREGLTMLAHGQIDAMPTMEPIATQMKDKLRRVFGVNDYIPSLTQLVGFTTTAFAKEHPETIRGIIEARRKGVQFINEHPGEAAEILSKRCEMPVEIAREVLSEFVKLGYWSEGDFDREGLDTNVAGLRMIDAWGPEEVDWSQVIDQSYLPENLRKPL